MGLVGTALPAFNSLTGKEVTITDLTGSTLLLFGGIGFLTALIAGTYPALYLSSFDAVEILRGTFRLSGGAGLRRGLVVFQFAMSIVLIVGTVTVYQQIRYIHSKHLGLERENVIYLPLEGPMGEQFATVKEELLRRPGIASVTSASSSPLSIGSSTHSISWRGKDPDSETEMFILDVDFDFFDVMKMELVEGRAFDAAFGTDSVNYIINEQARRVMGFEQSVSERLSFPWESGTVLGVVEDFHMTSLYSQIEPTILRLRPPSTGLLYVRSEPGRTRAALASLEEVFVRFNPQFPFEYQFLDESFRQTYRSEMVVGTLAGIFTAFALFIACLGLFGLAAFTAQQRTKEIGVRKVLGATVFNLASLLSRDFVRLVLIAFVVGSPVSYVIMQDWLDGFAYRTDIGPGIFLVTGTLVMILALATVSYQALNAALADPVHSLRYE